MQLQNNHHSKKIVITGITPSGTPHVGNYIGAIKPALELANKKDFTAYFFIADYHSLIGLQDRTLRQRYIYEVAATWLSLSKESEKYLLYRQSDIPEIMELYWILSSITPKGLLNRAHAYKSALDSNKNVNMALFNYPMLMAADILLLGADLVPVGKDQIQHIEIVRDVVGYFNRTYDKCFRLPCSVLNSSKDQVVGLDGRKMSKSYNNTIPIFASPALLKTLVMKIITNKSSLNDIKSTIDCNIFSLYSHFASSEEITMLSQYYSDGISWKEAKDILFSKINHTFSQAREKYEHFLSNPHIITNILQENSEKIRIKSRVVLDNIKSIIGL